MGLRVAELETLFTANVKDFETKTAVVDKTQKALAKSDPTVKVKADEKPALAAMGRVQAGAKKIDGTKATAKLDADASGAKAGVGQAESELKKVDGKSVFSKVGVKVDRGMARGVAKEVGELTGSTLGTVAGKGLSAGIIGALVGLPVVGAAVGLGVAIGENLKSGLEGELQTDLLMARTDLNPKAAAVIGRAAGEAYANNWGTSIAENMDTARVAIQGGLLNPAAVEADSQAVIESLAGVSQILGEEIPAVSRATATLLRTGLAKDAAGAFDLLVRGTKAGLNVSEDMLDTVDEYSTQFRKLGLSGPQAMGLLAQAVRGGARDTDVAADSIKEFALRAADGTAAASVGFDKLGVSGKAMQTAIAAGGPKANAMLGTLLTNLRNIKDPADRNAAALALFGTKAEDMGAALSKMDLSTAVAQLGTVEGAAKSAMDTLGDNTAGALASAQRNIEVATAGIKGALATAFAPQIKGFATFVIENRAAVMQFLLDLANGSIDAGRALVNAAASGTEGFGSFVGTAGPMVMGFLSTVTQGVINVMNAIPGMGDDADRLSASYNAMEASALKGFAATETGSKAAADAIRDKLIKNGLDPAQAKLNALGGAMVLKAKLHDASVALAKDIDKIGFAANGSKLRLDTHTGSVNLNTKAGQRLDAQIKAAVKSLDAEAVAAAKSGEGQKALTTRYGEGRAALVKQLIQMGFTAKQAQALADKYNAIPGKVETKATLDKRAADAKILALQKQINAIKQNKAIWMGADSKVAHAKILALQAQIDRLHGKNLLVTTTVLGRQTIPGTSTRTNVPRKGGGLLKGPGTSTSDSIMAVDTFGRHIADVSTDEFVVNAKSYAKHAGLVNAINADKLAGGGLFGINVSLPSTSAMQAALNAAPQMFPTGGGGGNAANRAIGRAMLAQFGWGMDQWSPLDALWNKESGWRTNAQNPNSSAYGIPQSLPGSKMASAGADWRTNPATQERWGMGYIAGRYHTPAGAWAHSQAFNWYGGGGIIPPGGMALNEPNGKPERQLSGHQTESFDRLVAVLTSGVGHADNTPGSRTCTHIWQIDGREIGRAAVTHMDGVLSGGLTGVGVS